MFIVVNSLLPLNDSWWLIMVNHGEVCTDGRDPHMNHWKYHCVLVITGATWSLFLIVDVQSGYQRIVGWEGHLFIAHTENGKYVDLVTTAVCVPAIEQD